MADIYIASVMINLQFKTNSLKIGSSVPSISLNHGRNLAKRPNGGSRKGNSCQLFVIRGEKYMHCQSEIRYILQKFKSRIEKQVFPLKGSSREIVIL